MGGHTTPVYIPHETYADINYECRHVAAVLMRLNQHNTTNLGWTRYTATAHAATLY